jgi:hypothetical protein
MVFNLILLILLAGIVYIHWIQGFFSGVISMTLAIVAAAMSMAYYESVIVNMLGGKMADYAHGMLLPTMFAAIYLVPRLVFDMLVPGNVRVPHLADNIGGALCGLIAGIFTLGVVSIGAQQLPFGADIAFWSRHELRTLETSAPGPRGSDIDVQLESVLVNDAEKLTPGVESGVWLGFDRSLSNFVSMQSDRGALRTERKFAAIYPDLPGTLFFQRLGPPIGATRTYTSFLHSQPDVSIAGTPRFLTQLRTIDSMTDKQRGKDRYPADATGLRSEGGTWLVAVPMYFSADAEDKDKLVRVAPGQIRLVGSKGKTYYPIGTLYRGNVLIRERRDDIVHIDMSKSSVKNERGLPVFVFQVETTGVLTVDTAGNPNGFEKGAFIEVKRLNYLPLAGVKIAGPDKEFFPKGDGYGSKIPPQPTERSPSDTGTDPVLRRYQVIEEIKKANLDRGPNVADVPGDAAAVE